MASWTGGRERNQTGNRQNREKTSSYTNTMQLIIIYAFVYIYTHTTGAITKMFKIMNYHMSDYIGL